MEAAATVNLTEPETTLGMRSMVITAPGTPTVGAALPTTTRLEKPLNVAMPGLPDSDAAEFVLSRCCRALDSVAPSIQARIPLALVVVGAARPNCSEVVDERVNRLELITICDGARRKRRQTGPIRFLTFCLKVANGLGCVLRAN